MRPLRPGQTTQKKTKTKPKVVSPAPAPAEPVSDVDPSLEKELQAASPAPTPAPRPVQHNRFWSHNLGDLVYIVPTDGILLALDYQMASGQTENKAFGFPLNTVRESANLVDYQFTYGLFNRLNIGVSGAYAIKDDMNTDFPNGTASQHASNSGPNEPDMRATYRLLDSDVNFMTLDLFLGYEPNIGNKKTGNTASSGNYLSGRDSASGGAMGAIKARGVEWMLGVTVRNIGSVTDEDATTAQKTTTDGYMVTTGTAGARTEILYFIHPYLIVNYSNVPSFSSRAPTQLTSFAARSFFSYDVGFDFDVIRESVLIRLDYTTTPTYSYDSTIIGSTFNTKVSRNQFSLGIVCQF